MRVGVLCFAPDGRWFAGLVLGWRSEVRGLLELAGGKWGEKWLLFCVFFTIFFLHTIEFFLYNRVY